MVSGGYVRRHPFKNQVKGRESQAAVGGKCGGTPQIEVVMPNDDLQEKKKSDSSRTSMHID